MVVVDPVTQLVSAEGSQSIDGVVCSEKSAAYGTS